MSRRLTTLAAFVQRSFAGWVVLAAVGGFVAPPAFTWAIPHIPLLLGIIMFGMGLTLSAGDFAAVLARPRDVFAGAAAQFTVMPLVGYALARFFHLAPELAVGVVLVGTCPGGTASNVITWFARGDVALSVTMTSVSTLLAPIATPLLTLWLAGAWVPVSAAALCLSVLKIVILPVALGVLARRTCARAVERALPLLPVVSVLGIVLIIAAVVGRNASQIATSAAAIFAVVILHNLIGLALGYGTGAAARMSEPKRRALSFEVGLQNSGLAVALALAHFSPAAAIAGALFSVWQNLSGALLAAWWARRGVISNQ